MNIGRQWEDRLRIWSEQFEKHFILDSIPLEVAYFTTMEHLSFAQAKKGAFQPAPVGTKWGCKWQYGWFHTSVKVPAAWEHQRLVLLLQTAEEMLVWVNGREAGAIDKKHRYIILTRSAAAGETFDIYAECYAGHGVRNEGAGPVGPMEETVPEPPEQQVTVGDSRVAVWNETMFQAAMDYRTLYSLVKKLPEKSLRAMKIIEGLKRFTYMADFELPEPELTAGVAEAAKVLQPLLACRNGSTAPEYTIFGQSHLDMAWLWPVEETMRKSARTYGNQLALMEEYPDYQFLLCEPPILEYLKELYPGVYRRVKEKVAAGSFLPEGALWIEADTNIPSGESLIRQFAWGKRWFREELGIDSRMAWMPDTFGFSAALPQIMKGCGVDYFATQKLLRQDPEAEPFPYNIFWWQGMDGSRVLSHVFKKNNANFDAGDLITRWEEDRIQQENIDGLMYPFGFGDGGGGPTRDMLEIARRCADLEGAPRCRMESPVYYFERAKANGVENVFAGELYLAWHRGTLTSQARTKKGIRKAEITLKQTEYLLARRMLDGGSLPTMWKEQLRQAREKLLFNQFHDIAPGTSIHRVHEQAEKDLALVQQICGQLQESLLGRPAEATVVINTSSSPRMYWGTTIPAQGAISLGRKNQAAATATQQDGLYILANEYMVCTLDRLGQVVSLRLAGQDKEFMAAPGNCLRMYHDVNTCYDAWELGSMYEHTPVALTEEATVSVEETEEGVALVVKRMLHHSQMEQRIFLGHHAKRLDFITSIQWQERHKLLKAAFPLDVFATEACNEIQFGYVKRPTHASRQSDRDQYEVCNHRYTALCDGGYGAAVLNDCKYGVSTKEKEISLTLLKSPLMPDMTADQGLQQFTYALYPFQGIMANSDLLQEATDLNEELLFGNAQAEGNPVFVAEKKNIVTETVMPAETREKALLVRVYEAMGMETETAVRVHPAVRHCEETDMLEENGQIVSLEKLRFRPFEIKTFLLHL